MPGCECATEHGFVHARKCQKGGMDIASHEGFRAALYCAKVKTWVEGVRMTYGHGTRDPS
jgi:hypothetical protein